MKISKINLVAIMLAIPLLGGCNSGSSVHVHNYVFHEGVAPSCLNEGMAAYYSCDGCDLYFNEAKEEIDASSLALPAIGHKYDVRITSYPNKTNYVALETFDSTGLSIEKYCERGDEQIAITEGITFDKTILHPNDTNVTAMVELDGQTKLLDIPVSVAKIDNQIKGYESSYNINCHDSLDFSAVTSDFGEVNVSIFDATNNEITNLSTISAGEYLIKFNAQGDEDHSDGNATSNLIVSHEFVNEIKNSNTLISEANCLTYAKYKKSCVCGATSENDIFEDSESGYGSHVLEWEINETTDVLKCVVDGCGHVEETFNKQLVNQETQVLDMSATSYSVNIATVGQTYDNVVSLKIGNHDLGTDPNNLDVSTLKEAYEDHGPDKVLEVVVNKNGYEHAYNVNVEVITKLIKTKADMNALHETAINQAIFGYYVLNNDIDYKGTQCDNSSSAGEEKYGFRGIFDGRGHTITNYSATWKPLFGMVGYRAVVKNLNLSNASLAQGYQHGMLCRIASAATFENITIGVKDISIFSGHEDGRHYKSGMISGRVANPCTFKNITINAQEKRLYGVLGTGVEGCTIENFVVNCKSYDKLGYSDDNGSTEISSFEGVTINLDPVYEEINALPVAYEISSATGSYTLPSEYEGFTVTNIKLKNTEISFGNDLSNLDFSAIKDNQDYIGDRSLLIIGTKNGVEAYYTAKIVFADKVLTTAQDIADYCMDDVSDGVQKTGYYALGNDIATSTYGTNTSMGLSNAGFAGTFNGCGHTVTLNELTGAGLFNIVNGGTITNTKFVATITSYSWKSHILAHKINNMTLQNCEFEYSITAKGTIDGIAGVIAGYQGGGASTIKNCSFTNTGEMAADLLFGYASDAYNLTSYLKLSGCSVSGNVTHFGCQGTSNALANITSYWDFDASASGQLVKYVEAA